MSTPSVSLPSDLSSLCIEIGRRLYDQALAAVPDQVRNLLDPDHSTSINDKIAIAHANQWRDEYNLMLRRLAKLSAEVLKQFKGNDSAALQAFRRKLTSGDYSDVDNFLRANDVPQKYLVELIATYVDDTKQFPKLLELFIKLGKG